jgi:hypothetical protein
MEAGWVMLAWPTPMKGIGRPVGLASAALPATLFRLPLPSVPCGG